MTDRPAGPSAGRWGAPLAGLLLAVLASFTAFGAVLPVLPVLVVDEMGASGSAVGLVFAASGLAAVVGRPYAGWLAQRWGPRRVMLLGCLGGAAVGGLYALPAGLVGLVATRVLMGTAEALTFTAGSVWVVAVAPASRRGQLVGYYGLAMWTGFTAGPLAGIALYRWAGYPAVWSSAAAAPLLAAAVLAVLPEYAGDGRAGPVRLLPRAVLRPGLALSLAAFGYAALVGYVALHLDARGVANGASLVSLFGAAYVGVRLLAARVPDRIGAVPVAICCALGEAVGLLLITLAHAWWIAAAGALVMGAGFTLLYPCLALLVIDRSPPAARGAAIGAFTSFWDLGIGGAGLGTGLLAQLGYQWVFVAATILAVSAAFTASTAGREPLRAAPAT